MTNPTIDADTPEVLDAGAVALPEGEGGDAVAALSPEEEKFISEYLDIERKSIESRIRYHQKVVDDATQKLASFEGPERAFLASVVEARRRLTAAGIVSRYDSWDRKVRVDLGHVAPKRRQSTEEAVAAALLPVAQAVGAVDPDQKRVDTTDHAGKKVLEVHVPARRFPVLVRYTVPGGKDLACQIVKEVTVSHRVLCTVGAG